MNVGATVVRDERQDDDFFDIGIVVAKSPGKLVVRWLIAKAKYTEPRDELREATAGDVMRAERLGAFRR